MKKFTPKIVVKMALAQLRGMSMTGTKPKPFPGNYPTRVLVLAGSGRQRQFTYLGKPTRQLWEKVLRISQDKTVYLYEFDRENIISNSASWGRIAGLDMPVSAASQTLWNYYHPWQRLQSLSWMREPFQIKKVRHEHQIKRVYGPMAKLTIQQLREFKRWLSNM